MKGRILFFTRLLLYLLAFGLPLVHPGIAVAYDRTGLLLWFLIVPMEAAIAFFLGPPRMSLRAWLGTAGFVLFTGAVLAAGFNPGAIPVAGAGAAAFLLTVLLFRKPGIGRHTAVLEQIFLAMIAFRMLGFSRASEDLAAESSVLTQGILIFSIAAFLLHGMVVYFAVYRRGKSRRELAVFAFSAVAAVILLTVLLPSDFVKNSMVANLLQDEVRPRPLPLDERGEGFPNGNLRSRDRDGGQNRLEGIPEDQWPGTGQGREGRDGRGGEDKQYAVMVVAGGRDPVYAGSSYRARFDPLRGFLVSEGDVLNELPRIRLLETWIDGEKLPDRERSEQEIYFLSTLPERYLPYRPSAVEPTVLHREYGPFRFSHRSRSRMSDTGIAQWRGLRDLTEQERRAFSHFLDVPLARNDLAIFDAHLRGALEGKTDYFEKILAILQSFSTFQYNIGYDEDTSVPAMIDFLTYTREGDCTEFSNTAAILGRLAGIPSRVVTGFLVSGDLQTPAHIRGLQVLRGAIRALQDFPLEELFLVTTAHRHSWTQFWLPEYGWVDFETTSFAIPPVGFGDPNNRDVVIPILQEDPSLTPVPAFPWKTLLRWTGLLLLAGLLSAYAVRYGREAFLVLRSRRSDDAGVRALYRLLLMRLAAEGRPIKLPSQTSGEYARLFPDEPAFAPFAALYTELRYRESAGPEARDELHARLCREYGGVLAGLRRTGPAGVIHRVFSLKGLEYL